mgnify:CR=1 FL=1
MAHETLRIVIADNESIIRMDLREMLEEAGHEIVGEAIDGRKAVELTRQHRPDLVIMDIKMPQMDGITAARKISEEKLAPVLLLTAFSQPEIVEKAKDSGVLGYLVKPVQIEGTKTPVGGLAGAAVGGVAGSNVGGGKGQIIGGIIGAVAGGRAGAAAEEGLTRKQGMEITVRLDNGSLIAVVQEADQQFAPGDRVRVLSGGGATRVSR